MTPKSVLVLSDNVLAMSLCLYYVNYMKRGTFLDFIQKLYTCNPCLCSCILNNLSQTLPRELKIDNLTYVDFAEVFMIFRLDYFLLYLYIYI